MKKIWLLILVSVLIAFALEPIEAVPKGRAVKTKIRDWPIDVHPALGQIEFKIGRAPQIEPIDLQKAKESLRPFTAKKIVTVRREKATQYNEIPSNRAEMLASYKAIMQKQQAESEIKEMLHRGASDKEIEAFKMKTDEKILNTRYKIMKTFGSEAEFKETEKAIIEFNAYKKTKEAKCDD